LFDFEYQLKILPDKPGVYLMKNSLGEIIYVGKAKILKNRVRQYFQNSKNHSEKVRTMVKHIAEFEYIVTDSEIEALVLECNLIKKHKPRYNILLKDDKQYPMLKITVNEDFPRIFITRNVKKDGAKYLGPYTNISAVYETLETIKQLFPLRTCRLDIKAGKIASRPCLNYHIGLCNAPCSNHITKEAYGEMIKEIVDLLSGKDISLVKDLKEKMNISAEALEFEKAAEYRNKLIAIEKVQEKQKMATKRFEDEDFIHLAKDDKDAVVQVFFVREGKVIGREHFFLENVVSEENSAIIAEFISAFYGGTAFIPKYIYVPEIEDLELLEQWLTMKRGFKVSIKIPQKGEKKDTLTMVQKNAVITLEQFKQKLIKEKEAYTNVLEELAEILALGDIPHRIEAYDISNIMGVDSVGAMVAFEEGKPKNSDYRRFKIKTVYGANDYDSMREILTRRFKRGLEEIEALTSSEIALEAGKFFVFPDLILMDGGKGQVNVALEVLRELKINIPVAGLVKDNNHKTRGIIYDNEEIVLKSSSPIMHFITRIQDEVHRFAITYHRSLRDKRAIKSVLDDIKGIGEKRRRNLLMRFGSIENIKNATLEELATTPSMDKRSAQQIKDFFKKLEEERK